MGPATSFFEQVIRKPADHLFSLIPMNLIIEPVPGSLAGCGCLPRVVPVAIVVEPLRGFWSNLSASGDLTALQSDLSADYLPPGWINPSLSPLAGGQSLRLKRLLKMKAELLG